MNAETKIKFVNTSMHGVGHAFAWKAFELYGFAPFIPVKEQQDPDPEFPTVKFPNPEEKGVYYSRMYICASEHIYSLRSTGMSVPSSIFDYTLIQVQDLALKTADEAGATYVLAQDPDADRFSAAEKG